MSFSSSYIRYIRPAKQAAHTIRTMTTTMQKNTKGPRHFAPLDSSQSNNHSAPKLKGVVFDVDGTLCLPQNYMFKEMRSALDIQKPTDILDHINTLSDQPDNDKSESPRSRAQEAIKQIEKNAMKDQQPQPGLNELITHLAGRDVRLALCTRNFELPVNHLLETFVDEKARKNFWPIVTRETEGVKAKPSPEGIWACVEAWDRGEKKLPESKDETESVLRNMSEEERLKACEGVIMVGDSVDDIEAGARAGAATVLLVNEENKHLLEEKKWPKKVDLGIKTLDELVDVLEKGFVGRE